MVANRLLPHSKLLSPDSSELRVLLGRNLIRTFWLLVSKRSGQSFLHARLEVDLRYNLDLIITADKKKLLYRFRQVKFDSSLLRTLQLPQHFDLSNQTGWGYISRTLQDFNSSDDLDQGDNDLKRPRFVVNLRYKTFAILRVLFLCENYRRLARSLRCF